MSAPSDVSSATSRLAAGPVQRIPDLAACKERELDLGLPIEVEGVLPDSEVSCRNTLSLLSYLENEHHKDLGPLLRETGLELDLAHLRDPHKWLSYVDSLKVFELARRMEHNRNPRNFARIGRHAHRWQTMGAGVDALTTMLPLRQVMWVAAEYGRFFNNGQFIRSVRQTQGELTLISRYAEFVRPVAVIDMDWWSLGIYTGFPERRGLPPARGEVEYSFFELDGLLDREYAWLGIRDHAIIADRTPRGQERRRWFVEGEEYAHEVVLLRESLVPGETFRGEDLFHPSPRELEEFDALELAELLRHRKACLVLQVTRTLERQGELVVREGELYGAPYSRFRLRWEHHSWIDRVVKGIGGWRNRLVIPAEALRQEIQAAKAEAMQATRERIASERKSVIFQTYASRSLIDRIDRGEDPRLDQPRLQRMGILFADLRGFTQVASNMSPEDTVAFLNSYFNRLNRPIYHHHGEIDKIMGDGMMAVFAEGTQSVPMACRAVLAAIDIRLALQAYNRERWDWHVRNGKPGESFPRVDNGIGIAFGLVVTGNIGSKHKLDHTLIGDPVNLASRLEGLTRHYGSAILVTEEVRDILPESLHVRFLDKVTVKGRDRSIRIFEVFDHEPDPVKEAKLRNAFAMEAAWGLYAAGMFREAGAIYEDLVRTSGPHRLLEGVSIDPALDHFAKRCRVMQAKVLEHPELVEAWQGVHGFEEK
jgi:class 3 adenylate cyclase